MSAITGISDCDAVMEFYEDRHGRIALYDEHSKGSRPTSEEYGLEWYAEKIDLKGLDMDLSQASYDFNVVQVEFYKHFLIELKGDYIFIQDATNSYDYEYGIVEYDNAEDWLIVGNNDSNTGDYLIIATVKLK